VLAIAPERLDELRALCERERCPFAVVGTATGRPAGVSDAASATKPVDMPMEVLLGKPPRMPATCRAAGFRAALRRRRGIDLKPRPAYRVLRLPAVASKNFLITIGDRSVGGMTARDQMVGPWQVPVADVAVTTHELRRLPGEALAMGERTPVATLDAPASGRMAIGEAITNIAAADIAQPGRRQALGQLDGRRRPPGEDAALFDTVEAVASSARARHRHPGGQGFAVDAHRLAGGRRRDAQVVAPLSLIVTAFAPGRGRAPHADAAAAQFPEASRPNCC
jgi:phosphoribosylformylglycinamidine synthase